MAIKKFIKFSSLVQGYFYYILFILITKESLLGLFYVFTATFGSGPSCSKVRCAIERTGSLLVVVRCSVL